MRIVATIEARMASSRLPGKVLMPLAGRPVLTHIVERLRSVPAIAEVIIATTVNPADEAIARLAQHIGVPVFRGSEEDVLGRVLGAARSVRGEILVEITGDCPLVDPDITASAIEYFLEGRKQNPPLQYAANVLEPGYPLGLAVQVFPVALLAEVDQLTRDPADREHVSYYIYRVPGRYRTGHLQCQPWLHHPDWRWTLDYPEDYEFLKRVYSELFPVNPRFGAREVVDLLQKKPEIADINRGMRQHQPLDQQS